MLKNAIVMSLLPIAFMVSNAEAATSTKKKETYEVTPFLGKIFTDELINGSTDESLSVSDEKNFGLSLAWQKGPSGQGQLLFNYASHDYNSQLDNSVKSFDVLYGHFGGVAQYSQQNYTTTVSVGVGGAHIKADEGSDVFPSVTMAVGTKYSMSPELSLVTELRAYGSLVDEDKSLFCKKDTCSAVFSDSLWVESTVWVGLAYKF